MTIRIRIRRSFAPLVRKLERLPAALKEANREIAKATKGLVMLNANKERDPYGRRWRKRKGSFPWRILNKSGRMLGSVRVRAGRRGFTITVGTSYAGFHQSGASPQNAARLIVPTTGRGLPGRWRRTYTRIIRNVIRKRLL